MERKKTKACEDGLYKVVSDNGINMFDGWGTMCELIGRFRKSTRTERKEEK